MLKKMAKIKNKDLMVIEQSLLYASSKQTAAWYQVGKNLRIIKKHTEEINKSRQDIVDQLAKKDKKGDVVTKGQGNDTQIVWTDEKKADDLWKELMEEEVEVPFYTFNAEKFGEATLDALSLEPLIDVVLVE